MGNQSLETSEDIEQLHARAEGEGVISESQ